jgi:hypothetical protein
MTGIITKLRAKLVNEKGSATLWFVITTPIMLVFLLFSNDVAEKIQSETNAYNVATAAARAGANALSGQVVANGMTAVDAVKAANAADGYLDAAGFPGTVSVNGDRVTVTIDTTYDTRFLPMNLPVHAQATSQLLTQ